MMVVMIVKEAWLEFRHSHFKSNALERIDRFDCRLGAAGITSPKLRASTNPLFNHEPPGKSPRNLEPCAGALYIIRRLSLPTGARHSKPYCFCVRWYTWNPDRGWGKRNEGLVVEWTSNRCLTAKSTSVFPSNKSAHFSHSCFAHMPRNAWSPSWEAYEPQLHYFLCAPQKMMLCHKCFFYSPSMAWLLHLGFTSTSRCLQSFRSWWPQKPSSGQTSSDLGRIGTESTRRWACF